MIIGFVYVSTRPDDYENALNQAKVIVPILIIGITLMAYFAMWHFYKQQEEQYIEKQFITVRSLIRGHHYPQAQDILAKINHPKAREWEAKIHDQSLQDSDLLKQLQ